MRLIHPFAPSPAGLTRGSIFFAQRWIAGSSPAMTLDERQLDTVAVKRHSNLK